jgi:hypothetical protein
MKFLLPIACVFAALHLVPGVSLGGEAVPNYFPLEAGRVWRYEVPHDEPFDVYWEIIVLAREGNKAVVRYQNFLGGLPAAGIYYDVRLQQKGSAIDIELEGEGFVPFYRFEEESFIHRDHEDSCNDNLPVRVLPLGEAVVPAGSFSNCLSVVYDDYRCTNSRRRYETWCPGVGLVAWGDETMGSLRWLLTAFEPTRKPFRRGDANTDGRVDISDPIATLRVLFLGEGYLPCEDAADSNDDGRLDISDAIFTLAALFTGGPEIPGPGADACGLDPTPDGIHCASFPPCFR